MRVLVTGAAGFIGSFTSHFLLDRGDEVVGVDNLNDYYDVALKEARLERLESRDGFDFHVSEAKADTTSCPHRSISMIKRSTRLVKYI